MVEQSMTPIARKLRRTETEAEKLLWRSLRARQFFNLKFRRQHPVGRFGADFACEELHLIVELDGGQHAENAYDDDRTEGLKVMGWQVQRYWNNDALENIDGVLTHLATVVHAIRR